MQQPKTITELAARIDAQQKKLSQLKERKAKLESIARAKSDEKERAADTRRKILAGAVILNAARLGKINPVFLGQLLDEGLEKASDREVFKLGPRETSQSPSAAKT